MEQFLLDRAAIFRNEPIFAYESALEFLQNRKFNDSLAMSRRAFYLSLKKNGNCEKEILYPLHRIYRQQGSITDVQAIEILQEIVESGRKIDSEFLDAKLKQTGYNRELLLFSLFISGKILLRIPTSKQRNGNPTLQSSENKKRRKTFPKSRLRLRTIRKNPLFYPRNKISSL